MMVYSSQGQFEWVWPYFIKRTITTSNMSPPVPVPVIVGLHELKRRETSVMRI